MARSPPKQIGSATRGYVDVKCLLTFYLTNVTLHHFLQDELLEIKELPSSKMQKSTFYALL